MSKNSDFGERTLRPTDQIPPFLLRLWERAAAFADLAAGDRPQLTCSQHSLLTRLASAMIVRMGGLPRERGSKLASAT